MIDGLPRRSLGEGGASIVVMIVLVERALGLIARSLGALLRAKALATAGLCAIRADGERRKNLLERRRTARWTDGLSRSTNQQLELVVTREAAIFEERHVGVTIFPCMRQSA
jgi:hypothetical protein